MFFSAACVPFHWVLDPTPGICGPRLRSGHNCTIECDYPYILSWRTSPGQLSSLVPPLAELVALTDSRCLVGAAAPLVQRCDNGALADNTQCVYVEPDCDVGPLVPVHHGLLGNCRTVLHDGDNCTLACDAGFALSPMHHGTSSSAEAVLC